MQGRVARQAESLFQWRASQIEDRPVCVEPAAPADESSDLSFVLADPLANLSDLFNLQPGDLLMLDEEEGSLMMVFADGEYWGSAQIGWDGDEPAVRLIKDEQ